MKYYLLILSLLILSNCAHKLNNDPNEIEFITSDIDRFWDTIDNYEGDLSIALNENYIKPGTKGLMEFIPLFVCRVRMVIIF